MFSGLLLLGLTGCHGSATSRPFTVYVHHPDAYQRFTFRVKWDGRYAADVSKVSGLEWETEVVTFREGSDPSSTRKLPGQTSYVPILLARARTHDTAFEQWANQIAQQHTSGGLPPNYRKDIIIDLFNEAGQVVMSFTVYRCWASHYVALRPLDSNSTDVVIESITLEHEGWGRDNTVTAPQ